MRKIIIFTLTAFLFISSFSATAADLKKGSNSFIKTMLPIITEVQNDIKQDKEKVTNILNKSKITKAEKEFLNEVYSTYRVRVGDKKTLMDKMIIPPTSLILAQASLESAWGKSRVAQKSNNLFGMKSFNSSEPRLKAAQNSRVYYRKYETIEESVKDYVINLSRHEAYQPLRKSIRNGESTPSLIKHLVVYGGSKSYPSELSKVIKGNNLTKYDI
ncbi:MAG: glucosaminidase domain-containing protein [Cetobacterium sp.]|uniref:glucosaminidase domain-containing protein n=1 Tax=Cetobacterium sp. TaxID=2071632 RepID=UPI002FCA5880